jgi:carbonic anhydrase/acetyltransferase-like protein (isoleucine patch superfamily)
MHPTSPDVHSNLEFSLDRPNGRSSGVPIYAVADRVPTIDPSAFVHPDAVVIGDVTIGAESTVWPGAVLRGDYGSISVGVRTSVQDGTVIHATDELPTRIGDECVIGHLVHLEGCLVEDRALVGSGSTVLHMAVVRTNALVGAGALVPPRMEVPSGMQAVGVPAKVRESSDPAPAIALAMERYVENGRRYRETLRRIDG